MDDVETKKSKAKKKHRNLFDPNQNNYMNDYGQDDDDDEDYGEEDDVDSEDNH